MSQLDLDEAKDDFSADPNDYIYNKLMAEQTKLDTMLVSMTKDPNLAKIFDIFATLLEDPNFESLANGVRELKTFVNEIIDALKAMESFAKEEDINEIHYILNQFSELLKCTKKGVTNVTEQAIIQQDCIEELLSNISKIHDSSQFDKSSFNDSIQILSDWICNSSMKEVIDQWKHFWQYCQVW